MNKKIIVIIIVLISLVIYGLDKLISDEAPTYTNTTSDADMDFKVIKPPSFSIKSEETIDSDDFSMLNTNELSNVKEELKKTQEARKANRQKIIELHRNGNRSFDTLGNILEKIEIDKSTSQNMKSHVERSKHNLIIGKKIANLTKQLHEEVDENGNREFKREVLDLIIAEQKKLILPTGNFSLNSESDNAN